MIVDGQIKSKRKTERQVAGDRWTISADRMVMGASQVVVTLDRASRRTASYLCSLQIRKDTPLESRWELSVPPSYPWLSYRVRISIIRFAHQKVQPRHATSAKKIVAVDLATNGPRPPEHLLPAAGSSRPPPAGPQPRSGRRQIPNRG